MLINLAGKLKFLIAQNQPLRPKTDVSISQIFSFVLPVWVLGYFLRFVFSYKAVLVV
jgi:hypothetical protein